MKNSITLNYDNNSFELPVREGKFEGKAIEIGGLRGLSGMMTFDLGLKNTSIAASEITYLNGEKGELLFRGYPIEQLSTKSSFEEVSYLLLYGELPTTEELSEFQQKIAKYSVLSDELKQLLKLYPENTHPMAILMSLTAIIEDGQNISESLKEEDLNEICIKLIGEFKVLVSWIYRKRMGLEFNESDSSLNYIDDFSRLMFHNSPNPFHTKETIKDAIDKLLILHADHEQNCSTFTVRTVGSSHASVHASVASGVAALWGKLHGGANQAVIETIEKIVEDGGNIDKWLDMAKDKDNPFRLMGVGHRVYKNFDPRAQIIKKAVDSMLKELDISDVTLSIAKSIEEKVLADQYFIERKLYPNVDFYSGIIYQSLDIPKDMFTVIFALGRLPGWLTHWKEMKMQQDPIFRPGQIYVGASKRDFVDLKDR